MVDDGWPKGEPAQQPMASGGQVPPWGQVSQDGGQVPPRGGQLPQWAQLPPPGGEVPRWGQPGPAAWTPQPMPPPNPWTPVLVTGMALVVVLAAWMALVGVPYVVLSPGPVRNTLGSAQGGELITVDGEKTYPVSGALDLTTVSLRGGPETSIGLFTAIKGWVRGDWAVYPEELLYPKGQTAEQAKEESQTEMADSQSQAKAAALRELGYKLEQRYAIASFVDGSPAAGKLEVGDVILAIDGTPITSGDLIRPLVRNHAVGDAKDPVKLRVRRAGAEKDVEVVTAAGEDGKPALRVSLVETFDFPFDIKIKIDDIGGPSAGTMFALGIIDKLTPGEMTGGKSIAGTGTIDAAGDVGEIGGIRQKVVGARDAGARWFLAPAGNCDELKGHLPDGLTAYRIETLHQARTVVEEIGRGEPVTSVARCG